MNVQYRINQLTAEQYALLRAKQNMSAIDEQALEAAICGTQLTISATVLNDTVGMLRVIGDGALFCYIQDVLVDHAYRGCGIGKEMVRMAMREIEAHAPEGVPVVVTLVAEPGMEGFYEQLGFHKTPNILTGHAMQCILCRKPVKKIYRIKNL